MKSICTLLLPEFNELLEARDAEAIAEAAADLHAADIADLISCLDDQKAAQFFESIPDQFRISAFEYLPEHDQSRLYHLLGKTKMLSTIETMSSDDRVAFLRHLPPATVDALLPLIAQAERDDIRKLFSYAPNTAGALMTTEYVAVKGDITVGEAIETVRKTAMSKETIYYLYVVNGGQNLIGVLSLRSLVVANPSQRLSEIMTTNVMKIRADEDQEHAAASIRKYSLLAIPVTDSGGKLVGIITQDDAVDVIVEESTEDAHKMGGILPFTLPYFKANLFSLTFKRAFWLSILYVAGILTSTTMKHYESILGTALLVIFIPLILASGGNSGSQSAVLITRALALGHVTISDWTKIFLREFITGLLLGASLSLLGFAVALLLGANKVALVVGISLIAVVTCGTVIGSMLPIVLKRFGVDPAISSSPFVSSLSDIVGITIYFQIATFML